jgi:HK97 family phage prohead protease
MPGTKNKKIVIPKDCAEMRSFVLPDLKAEPEGNVIYGHAAVFGERATIGNWFYEVIERGAFDKTDFTDVLMSVCNHDLMIPIARSRNNNANSTLQLQVDDQGLGIRAVLDVDKNADARAVYSAIERGDISGMSLIMSVRGDRWEGLDTDMPTRYVTDIGSVFEVTPASIPAYTGTDIYARSDQRALESAARALESARSKLDSEKNELERIKLRTQILMKG